MLMKKFWKKLSLILLLGLAISLIGLTLEMNYCHSWTTTPPPGSPSDYIKTGVLCDVDSVVAIPGIILFLAWKALISLF